MTHTRPSSLCAPQKRLGRDEGFALLLVLWMLGFLALLVSETLSTGRAALHLGEASLLRTRLETSADAAITTELFSLVTGDSTARGTWRSSGNEREGVQVRSVFERGKINPNRTNLTLLRALLVASGSPADKATMLANLIFAWKNPEFSGPSALTQAGGNSRCVSTGAPFHTLDDLAVVPGMTPAVLAAIRPHISLAQMQSASPFTPDPVVRAALRQAGLISPGQAPPPESDYDVEDTLVLVDAVASFGGGSMLRHAEVILLPDARPVPWRVVRWETGEAP